MKANLRLILWIILAVCGFPWCSYAKPMATLSLEEALQSKYIVIAEVVRFSPEQNVSYFSGVTARYDVKQILKGPAMRQKIIILYEFHDGSVCLEPKNWRFDPESLPKKKSHWILFLNESDRVYITYRGSYGRWTASNDNLAVVKSKIIQEFGELSTSTIIP